MEQMIKNTVNDLESLYAEVIDMFGNNGANDSSVINSTNDWFWIAGSVIMVFGAVAFFS